MAYTLIIVGLCIIFALVIAIVNYYGNRKTSPWYVRLSVTIGLFFPFSIVLVLPLDITSVSFFFFFFFFFFLKKFYINK